MGAEMNRLLLAAMGALIVILAALSWTVNHYRDNAQLYKAQRDRATSSLTLANNTLTDMQARQHDVSALDAQYTGELANAKAELEKLHADVAIGRKRLQLNATCQAARSASSPAWMMAPVPDLLTPLNGIISPSESVSIRLRISWQGCSSMFASSVSTNVLHIAV
jgi:prophage endopeptidase